MFSNIFEAGLQVLLLVCVFPLLIMSGISLISSFLQAVLQIQEQSIAYVIKIFSFLGSLYYFSPLALDVMQEIFNYLQIAVAYT